MKKIITLFLMFIIMIGYSQNNSGEIIYSIKVKKNNKLTKKADSINSKTKDASIAKLMNSITKSINNFDDVEFRLTFNKNESYYSYIEEMDTENSELSNMLKDVIIESNKKYNYNYKAKIVSMQTEFDGKKYIINSNVDSLKWKLNDNEKIINNYKCSKATTIKYKEYPSGIKEVPVTAWYSLDIPIPAGPGRYNGLPGLILELQEGNNILYVKKIKLSKTPKKIKKLKGENISEENFEKMWRQGLSQWGLNE